MMKLKRGAWILIIILLIIFLAALLFYVINQRRQYAPANLFGLTAGGDPCNLSPNDPPIHCGTPGYVKCCSTTSSVTCECYGNTPNSPPCYWSGVGICPNGYHCLSGTSGGCIPN